MKLSAAARATVERVRLGFVATIDGEGRPAVSPKGTFIVVDDETLAFGHIRSPGTVGNLARDPALEVAFVDPFLRKGVRVRGMAETLAADGDGFAGLIGTFREIWADLAHRIEAIVLIRVTEVRPLTTPPYDDGATEEEMIALYKAKYAEMYP